MSDSQEEPLQSEDARRHVSVGLDAQTEARLDAYTASTGKSRSAAVRDLVAAGLMELLGRGFDAAERGSGSRNGSQSSGADLGDTSHGGISRSDADADADEATGESLAVEYVAAHPRATMAQIAAGLGLSRSGASHRMRSACAKGLAANAGTDRHPLWEVPGVEHAPEELLTERQARVLACLRRDSAPTTAQIAAELGCAASTVNNECRVLEARGLAHRAARGHWTAADSARGVGPVA